jgi:hypothetical protein
MCILNRIQILSRDVILHTFQGNSRVPLISLRLISTIILCVDMYYVMHMTGGSQKIKFEETYAKSVKTGQSSLKNRIIEGLSCLGRKFSNIFDWCLLYLKHGSGSV